MGAGEEQETPNNGRGQSAECYADPPLSWEYRCGVEQYAQYARPVCSASCELGYETEWEWQWPHCFAGVRTNGTFSCVRKKCWFWKVGDVARPARGGFAGACGKRGQLQW